MPLLLPLCLLSLFFHAFADASLFTDSGFSFLPYLATIFGDNFLNSFVVGKRFFKMANRGKAGVGGGRGVVGGGGGGGRGAVGGGGGAVVGGGGDGGGRANFLELLEAGGERAADVERGAGCRMPDGKLRLRSLEGMEVEWDEASGRQRSMMMRNLGLLSFHHVPHVDFPRLHVAQILCQDRGRDDFLILRDVYDADAMAYDFFSALSLVSVMFWSEDKVIRDSMMVLVRSFRMMVAWSSFDPAMYKAPQWETLGGVCPWKPRRVVERFRAALGSQRLGEEDMVVLLGSIRKKVDDERMWDDGRDHRFPPFPQFAPPEAFGCQRLVADEEAGEEEAGVAWGDLVVVDEVGGVGPAAGGGGGGAPAGSGGGGAPVGCGGGGGGRTEEEKARRREWRRRKRLIEMWGLEEGQRRFEASLRCDGGQRRFLAWRRRQEEAERRQREEEERRQREEEERRQQEEERRQREEEERRQREEEVRRQREEEERRQREEEERRQREEERLRQVEGCRRRQAEGRHRRPDGGGGQMVPWNAAESERRRLERERRHQEEEERRRGDGGRVDRSRSGGGGEGARPRVGVQQGGGAGRGSLLSFGRGSGSVGEQVAVVGQGGGGAGHGVDDEEAMSPAVQRLIERAVEKALAAALPSVPSAATGLNAPPSPSPSPVPFGHAAGGRGGGQ